MRPIIVKGTVFIHPGSKGLFVVLTQKQSELIRKKIKGLEWGSPRVQATLRKTSWNTMLFPTKGWPYLLSIRKDIRKKERVENGDKVKIRVEFI